VELTPPITTRRWESKTLNGGAVSSESQTWPGRRQPRAGEGRCCLFEAKWCLVPPDSQSQLAMGPGSLGRPFTAAKSVTRGSLPLPELRRKDSNVVIGLERLNLPNCKYNLLWLQKSLTSGNLNWWKSCPSYAQSFQSSVRFQGFPFFRPTTLQDVSDCLFARPTVFAFPNNCLWLNPCDKVDHICDIALVRYWAAPFPALDALGLVLGPTMQALICRGMVRLGGEVVYSIVLLLVDFVRLRSAAIGSSTTTAQRGSDGKCSRSSIRVIAEFCTKSP